MGSSQYSPWKHDWKAYPSDISLKEVTKSTGISRITASKYLGILKAEGRSKYPKDLDMWSFIGSKKVSRNRNRSSKTQTHRYTVRGAYTRSRRQEGMVVETVSESDSTTSSGTSSRTGQSRSIGSLGI